MINNYVLVFCFLIFTSVIIFLSREKQHKNWKIFLIINVLLVLCFIGLFYFQTAGLLSRAFHDNPLDNYIIQFEKKWFGDKNPSIRLSEVFHFNWLSELLHLCYLSYFLLLYGVPFYFYCQHDYAAFYQFEFAELLILLSAFLTHSVVPVLSPRTLFEKIQSPMRYGLIYRATHAIVQSGSADGTAFPSTHVAIGTLMLLMAFHMHTVFFYGVALLALGLIICTVYGRFHYVVDLLAGMVYGCVVFMILYF